MDVCEEPHFDKIRPGNEAINPNKGEIQLENRKEKLQSETNNASSICMTSACAPLTISNKESTLMKMELPSSNNDLNRHISMEEDGNNTPGSSTNVTFPIEKDSDEITIK